MLVLCRKPMECIMIGDQIKIVFLGMHKTNHKMIKLGIEAPTDIIVDREEIYWKRQEEKKKELVLCDDDEKDTYIYIPRR